MTSDKRRFPVGLTLAAALGFAICAALGVWQVQRGQWKQHVLAQLAARQAAAAQPIGPVLARAARGEDASFTRVTAECGPGSSGGSFKSSSDGSEWTWRPIADCRLAGAPFAAIAVDRGVVDASRGSTSPPALALPAPRQVVGVLRPAGPARWEPGVGRLAPYVLVAEQETPPAPGVTPSPFTTHAPENLQYVGAYAPTWFGLAGVLACVYAAMLWRRRSSS